MTDPARRWDAPWTDPAGARPQRDPGEPTFPVLAALHVGVYLGVGAVAGLVGSTAEDGSGSGSVAFAVLAVVLLVAGGAAWAQGRSSGQRLWDWTADLLLAAGAASAGGAAALAAVSGASEGEDAAAVAAAAGAVTAAVAAAAYAVVRRAWLLLTAVAGTAVALVGVTQQSDESSYVATGALVVVLAAFVLAGALAGVLRPVGVAYVAAALTALAGSQVMLLASEEAGAADGAGASFGVDYAVSALVLAAIAYAVVRSRSASVLPVVLVGGFVLLPQLLAPAMGGGYAFGLSVLGVGVGVAWLSVDVVRRSPRPVHNGGVFLTCTVFVLLAAPILCAVGNELVGVVAVLLLAAFFAAAACVRRRPATVISGVQLVAIGPEALAEPFGGSQAASTVVALLLVPAVIAAALWLDKRAPRPAASPYAQEEALAGAGETFTVVGAYPQVFDNLVGLLGGAGLALQLVDRAGGRIVAGDAAAPVFVIAVWAADPVRTHVRAVGAAHDVTRLRGDLEARLAAGATTHLL